MIDANASQRFRPQHRLRSSADFKRVYERRCSAGDSLLIVYGCENRLAHARLGLSVSRKVGPAVARNRWKRRLREAFRLQLAQLPAGIDLVIVPRAQAAPELKQLMSSLSQLARRVAGRLAKGKP
jgi:ribonuclease P protein component